MTFITGEQLSLLAAPARARSQLEELIQYLTTTDVTCPKVCALYGLRRTGKTTLILQAIKQLLEQGVSVDKIGYFTGMKGDNFDDLYLALQEEKQLDYIFIDEIGYFANFLQGGSYLYDTLVRLYNRKVVIAGTNLLALHVAAKRTLYDRCRLIRIPYLSFYEHCSFVLNTEAPTHKQFMAYMKTGGLFQQPEDIAEYVQTSITDSIVELFDTQPENEVFVWLKPESESVDWKGYVNTVLFLSSNYISNKSFQRPLSLIQDYEVLNTDVSKQVARDFREYFSLTKQDRSYRMKRTETVALLDFMVHCGVITVLPNLFDDTEPYKCYVQTPFLRFHFTEQLRKMAGGLELDEHKPLFGDLLEAAVISEYHRSHPSSDIFFARTHCSPDAGEISEIDLIDQTDKLAYEVKLTDGSGYKGFTLLSDRPELKDFSFTMLQAENYASIIYEWGETEYQIK